MNLGFIFSTVIIYPIRTLIEFFYVLFTEVFKNPGISVIGVSFVFTLSCLPLYIVAEDWQEKERAIQDSMKDGIKRIKQTFKGDEQYMMLTTYYKQHNYHPLMALRSSFGILIQIPFFIAAYSFLAHLQQLHGASFLFIKDMGVPDACFNFFAFNHSFNINVLPIAMTLINIISGMIYSKGHGAREKIQIFISAGLFLVLLYNMPAGLVLYWTMNNIFSTIKNICYKLPKKFLGVFFYIFFTALYLFTSYYVIFIHTGSIKNRLTLVCLGLIIPLLPIIIKFAKVIYQNIQILENNKKTRCSIFIPYMLSIFLLVGIVLPSFVVASSPAEFSNIDSYTTPLFFIFNCLLQAAGLCLFWPVCLYFLFNKKIQVAACAVFSSFCICAVLNSFVFTEFYGNISTTLKLDKWNINYIKAAINLVVICFICVGVVFIIKKQKTKILTVTANIILIAFLAISVLNCVVIQNEYSKTQKIVKVSENNLSPIYSLSKTQKNVLVIFLDRFTSSLFTEILKEMPELNTSLSGFTYFPNAISYGLHTIVGAPAMLGGYEYRPEQINDRKDELLQDKINEAILTLPRLFNDNGFSVVFSNPSGASAEKSAFDFYPEIKTPETNGTYRDLWYTRHGTKILPVKSTILKRDFLWLSLFTSAPIIIRKIIYKNNWWSSNNLKSMDDFIDAYSALDFLPELTDYNQNKPTFTFVHNMLPHEPMFLDAPNYTPPENATSIKKSSSKYAGIPDYYSAAASIRLVSKWFNTLKANGCYDNTKIIICSDHGVLINTGVFNDNKVCQVEGCNPLFLIKDFNATGNIKTDNEFMTQADVPYIATKGVIDNAKNPVTQKEFSMEKKNNVQKLFMNHNNTNQKNGKYEYNSKIEDWYTIHDDIFTPSNWGKLEK